MRQKPMAAAPVSLVQNLEDAGCGPELVKEFLALKETGDVNGQMRLLRIHRQCLLEKCTQAKSGSIAWIIWYIRWKKRTLCEEGGQPDVRKF